MFDLIHKFQIVNPHHPRHNQLYDSIAILDFMAMCQGLKARGTTHGLIMFGMNHNSLICD